MNHDTSKILTQSHKLGQYSLPTVCEGYRDDEDFDDAVEAETATEEFMRSHGIAWG